MIQHERAVKFDFHTGGIYSAVGVSAWICVAIFVAILVYIVLIKAGAVPNPKKEKAPLEAPLDAEASVE